jgi:methylthioribose-1-phosphate isomerase
MSRVDTLRLVGEALELIDQRRLPAELRYVSCRNAAEVAQAIRDMVVRGAPAIGCTAAYGFALEAGLHRAKSKPAFDAALKEAFDVLARSRPTAVNLFWALARMRERARQCASQTPAQASEALLAEAVKIQAEDIATNRAIGAAGAELVADGARIMTHCNTGALATAGHGTALGVVRSARDQGKKLSVLANETRPFLQGARLTAWELVREGIPVTLITDSMAGHMMQLGKVDLVLVGADRIAANGDVANKIGTYTLAVLAARHYVPFYVAAPLSTVDRNIPDGRAIPIEERDAGEVTGYAGIRWAPEGVAVANPAFDVTPAELVSGIITEKGIVRRPYEKNIRGLFEA